MPKTSRRTPRSTSKRGGFAVRMNSSHTASSILVGDHFVGDATALASLDAAAARLYSMLPQFVSQHVRSESPERADLTIEVFQISDDAPRLRVVFHPLAPTHGRWDVVAHTHDFLTTVPIGPTRAQDTEQVWQAEGAFLSIAKRVVESTLHLMPAAGQARTILELRNKTAGDRAVVSLIGF